MRKKYNEKLLKKLEEYLSENPEIRFIQALWNLGIIDKANDVFVDRYYEEPIKTYKRIRKNEKS